MKDRGSPEALNQEGISAGKFEVPAPVYGIWVHWGKGCFGSSVRRRADSVRQECAGHEKRYNVEMMIRRKNVRTKGAFKRLQ